MRRYLFLKLIALNAMVSYAYDFEVDGIEYNLLSIENNTVEVANASNVAGSADGTDRVLVIPASININGRDLKVVSIGKEAVRGPEYNQWTGWNRHSGLFSEIYLPETIETIGYDAFYEQKNLEIVELPQSLKRIEDYAFCQCVNLRSVIFKDGLKHIGKSAFASCPLEEIDLPDSVEFLGDYAICDTGIRTFKFPNSVKEIGQSLFWSCDNLEYLDLEQLRSFGKLPAGLLAGSCVRRVVIPDWVSTIPEKFFQECMNIEELEFGTALEHIEDYAFSDCTFHNPIVLPEGLKTIGFRSFSSCTFHNPIVLPEGLKTIGEQAFHYSEMEGALIVPSSVEEAGDCAFAFAKLDSLIILPSDVMLIGAYSSTYDHDRFKYYINMYFSEFNFLSLGRGVYDGTKDREVYYQNAKVVEMSDAFLRSQSNKTDKYYKGVQRLVILEGVENLDYYFKCNDTNSILLPSTLKTIKSSNFKETKNLTNVDCRAQEPPQCDGKIFADILYTTAKLTVPLGCKEAYQNAEGWKYFWNIEETKEVAYDGSHNDIKAVMQDDVDWFSVTNGGIKAAERLEIYSLDGRMVKRVERGEDVDSLHGMYIIKSGSKTAKVML